MQDFEIRKRFPFCTKDFLLGSCKTKRERSRYYWIRHYPYFAFFPEVCQGFGDPHFKTFDGLFFPFQAVGSFLIVSDTGNNFEVNGLSRKCGLFNPITCLVGMEIIYGKHKISMKKDKDVRKIFLSLIIISSLSKQLCYPLQQHRILGLTAGCRFITSFGYSENYLKRNFLRKIIIQY